MLPPPLAGQRLCCPFDASPAAPATATTPADSVPAISHSNRTTEGRIVADDRGLAAQGGRGRTVHRRRCRRWQASETAHRWLSGPNPATAFSGESQLSS